MNSPDDSTAHPAAWDADRLLTQCTIRRTRRSGPGGQHRNKVETAVVITHAPSGIRGEASERRSQEENRRVALLRLRVNLALGLRGPDSSQVLPSALWRSRCRNERIQARPSHEDFPALLAEALDALVASGMDAKPAAQQLGISLSQLIKFLKLEPRALEQLNAFRRQSGLHPLH